MVNEPISVVFCGILSTLYLVDYVIDEIKEKFAMGGQSLLSRDKRNISNSQKYFSANIIYRLKSEYKVQFIIVERRLLKAWPIFICSWL